MTQWTFGVLELLGEISPVIAPDDSVKQFCADTCTEAPAPVKNRQEVQRRRRNDHLYLD